MNPEYMDEQEFVKARNVLAHEILVEHYYNDCFDRDFYYNRSDRVKTLEYAYGCLYNVYPLPENRAAVLRELEQLRDAFRTEYENFVKR